MENGITKKEKYYISFNIRGFFKHYKIEENINKLSIDLSNLQKMEQEINNLQNELDELNKINEEMNNNALLNNQSNKTRLKVNKRHKFITKSTDKVTKKIVENKQKLKLKDLKYDLNKSNMTLRPKTPDISKIFGKYKKKRSNMRNKSNSNLIDNNYTKIGSKSFVQTKYYTKNNTNICRTNKININFDYNLNNNKNLSNYNKDKNNSFDSKEKELESINYTLPGEKEKKIEKKFKKKIRNDKLELNNLSQNKINKNNNNNYIKKEDLYIEKTKKINNGNIINSKANKTKKLKKLNINKKILNERFHSTDITQINEQKNKIQNNKLNLNKIYNKKIAKLNFNKRMNAKTPSPINYRHFPPLLIDHETIIKNKNKRINYNGNYHNNKTIKKKLSNDNFNKNRKNNITNKNILKTNSIDKISKKDITKEEEKKLEEQIIISNNTNEGQNYSQINNAKNIMDLSQNILKQLEYMNNADYNKNESNGNVINLSDTHNNNQNKKNNAITKNSVNLFKSNYIESLYLTIKLGFFHPWEKLKLLLISKELNFKFDLKDIINDYINYYEKKIILISNEINKYDIHIINKPFTPRKTGLNSLNFITKNEEQRLINEEQHDYVIKIFTIILILLNEYDNFANYNQENENKSKIFEFLFNEIYNKNKVNNIKDLFIKCFVEQIPLISDNQFNTINDIIKEIPELLSPSTLLAYNRNVSYLIFFLSELYNYLKLKTDDDIYYYIIRNKYFELKEYINKINKLKIYL